jgi:hypothetical protein
MGGKHSDALLHAPFNLYSLIQEGRLIIAIFLCLTYTCVSECECVCVLLEQAFIEQV